MLMYFFPPGCVHCARVDIAAMPADKRNARPTITRRHRSCAASAKDDTGIRWIRPLGSTIRAIRAGPGGYSKHALNLRLICDLPASRLICLFFFFTG